MLHRLSIKNFVLVESLDLTFDRGLSVITGETGAGKSVMISALGLILGQRADTKAIKEGCDRCVLEAEFTDIDAINKQIEQNAKKNGTSIGVERAKYVQTMLGTGKGHEGFWNNFWNDGSARWESTAGQRAGGIASMVLGGANGRFESWNVRRLGTMDSFLNNYLEASYNNFVDR